MEQRKMLDEIKESFVYIDEYSTEVALSTEYFNWLIEQAEENIELKDSIDRGEEKYREEILPELQKTYSENKKLKKQLAFADKLIKKSKELTDLYQTQIEQYEIALKFSQTQK